MQNKELPNEWVVTKLGNVCSKPQYGYTTKASAEGYVKFLRTTDITKGVLDWETVPYCLEVPNDVSKYQLLENDIVISRAGSVGFSALLTAPPENAVFASYLIRFQPSNSIEAKYLKRFLESGCYWSQLAERAAGNAVQNVNANKLADLDVLIAPVAEQKQIADKLDDLLAQVDSIKTRLDAIPAILKRFRQSVLAAAVSGRLTEEWRVTHKRAVVEVVEIRAAVSEQRRIKKFQAPKLLENEMPDALYPIPKSWRWFHLGNLALKITDGAHNTPKVLEAGYPYLMAKDLTGGVLDFSENRFISEKDHRELYAKCKPEAGDLLVVNIGAGTGNNVLIDVDFEFSFKNVAIIKRSKVMHSKYVKWFFDSQKDRIFAEQTRGGAQPFLSLTLLNTLQFALPPIEEQAQIVERIEQLFDFATQVEQCLTQAQTRINQLTQSILAKAFRGELTADWREQHPELISGEQSAQALLDRIRAEREKLAPTKCGRKKKAASQ